MVFITSSCEDILDLNPLDKMTESNVWADKNLIKLYVNASYHSIESGFGDQFNLLMWSSLSDETFCIHDGGSYIVQKGELTSDNVSAIGTGTFGINPTFDYWKKAYSSIRDINIYFSHIDSSPIDANLKASMNAEMKFIRAYIYSQLIWRYGGVPIIKDVFRLGDDFSASRNSYDECVSFINSELDDVIADLPKKQPEDQKGRASGDAAKALKSRVLLYAASPLNNPSNDLDKWQKAADAAESLLSSSYSLSDDYQSLFLKENNEIIFAKYYSQNNAHTINLFNGRNGSNGWGSNCPTQNLVDDYEMNNGKLISDPTSGYNAASPYVNRDPRFYASILYDGAVWMGRETEIFKGGLDSRESSNQAWNGSLTGYNLKKFLPSDIPPTGAAVNPTNPFIYFRYGEILLNYAEAKFELGDEITARVYLNMIRSRSSVNMPAVTETGNALRKRIQHERRIELVFEGHRFYDVRRWKIATETESKTIKAMTIMKLPNGSITYEVVNLLTRTFSDKHYFLPIPRIEIERSLGSLSQNPGY